MKRNWKTLLLCVVIPLAVGGLAALLTGGTDRFGTLERPPLAPPGWLFPVVWTALYALMGAASYRVLTSGNSRRALAPALGLYGLSLFVNFFWPIIFFRLGVYLFAFAWLVLLWLLVLDTGISFSRIDRTAGKLMIPYLLWVTFAGYLNLGIWLLN